MRSQLRFQSGKRAGGVVRLERAETWLGRDPSCDVTFDPQTDLTVSGRHARIVLGRAGYELIDQSANGTLINGQPAKVAPLRPGDVLELGRGGPKLSFELVATPEATAPSTPQAAPATVAQLSSPASAAPATNIGAHAAPASPAPPRSTARLSSVGVNITITRLPAGPRQAFDQPVIRIGRDPSADVPLDPHADLLVSYAHAKIMVLDARVVLFDTESRNGTFIDGARVGQQDLVGEQVVELGQGGPRLAVTVSGAGLPAAKSASTPMASVAAPATVFGGALSAPAVLSLGDADLLGEYPLYGELSIGREPHNRVVLDSMHVSARHALVRQSSGRVTLTDLGSANGTFVAGQRVREADLSVGVEFVVGPFVLKCAAHAIQVFDTRQKTWVAAHGLCRVDERTHKSFLDRVSLKINPGEFVCILGPSGCGKSTLLKCLNGLSPAQSGTVLVNGIDLYAHYPQLKHQLGYVPQDDIIHPTLTVLRTLEYAAQLRLPAHTGSRLAAERIRDVLSALELYDHRNKVVHTLSGGQRKRVSIAVELLTDPAIIFLDEPTSGLDPHLEEKMMLLLREMTLRGKTVASVTHTLDNIHLADKVIFLVDGKLAFFGQPAQALSFFQVQRLPEVYKHFDARNSDALRETFEQSPLHHEHVGAPESVAPEPAPAAKVQAATARTRRVGSGALSQFLVLTRRYLELTTRDVRNTVILLAQAPLVALFVVLAVKTDQPERGPTSTMFLIMSLSALWFGCASAARELTKEAAVYGRERMVNLGVIPYVASKFFVLQLVALVQVTSMLLLVSLLRSGYTLTEPPQACAQWNIHACSQLIQGGVPGSFALQLLNLYLTALAGIGLGLLISATAGNSDKAMSLVPLVLIPQVLFSGSFGVPTVDESLQRGAGYAMSLNWSLDQAKRIAMCTPEQEQPRAAPGSGCESCLHGYDPFKHRLLKTEAQDDDRHCQAVLTASSQMTEFPEALHVVEDGLYTPPSAHGRGAARDATRSFVGLFVQGGFVVAFFLLVCVAVRLKDRKRR